LIGDLAGSSYSILVGLHEYTVEGCLHVQALRCTSECRLSVHNMQTFTAQAMMQGIDIHVRHCVISLEHHCPILKSFAQLAFYDINNVLN